MACIRSWTGGTEAWDAARGAWTPARCTAPPDDALDDDYASIMAYLRALGMHAHDARHHVVDFLEDVVLHTTVTVPQFADILHGAFTVLADGGVLHRRYRQYRYKKPTWIAKMSSHGHVLADEYRMGAGSVSMAGATNPMFDILLGTDRATGNTAFQFERRRIDTFRHAVAHGMDYFRFVKHGQNVGAFGTSAHTDANPMRLPQCTAAGARRRPCKAKSQGREGETNHGQ